MPEDPGSRLKARLLALSYGHGVVRKARSFLTKILVGLSQKENLFSPPG